MRDELIAPCGMNCAICSSYLAQLNDVKSRGLRMSYCTGCRPRNKQCAFLKKRCEKLLNNTLTSCSECPDFPCQNLQKLDVRYRALYHMSMISNLNVIKEKGLQHLLKSEEQKWQCPRCGGTISCHNGICFSCGLEKLKVKKLIYRWDDEDTHQKKVSPDKTPK